MGNLEVTQLDVASVQQHATHPKKQLAKPAENVSFWDEAWTGNQIAKLTGDNLFTDWLQNKDKVCTDGKDDGKLSVGQYTLSFVKGLIGGIPKMMINHPIATAVTLGVGAGLIALTGGAIIPVLGAAGVTMGIGMAGLGTYKAITAKTDGEAKQALETMGTGVTTTALSIMSSGKSLQKAAEAGVKTANVSENANIFQKTWQMFKSIPESLKMSKAWACSYIKGTPINIELADGSKQVKVKGELIEETLADGTIKKYSNGSMQSETLSDGTHRLYKNGVIKEETLADGTYTKYDNYGKNYGRIIEQDLPDGTHIESCNTYNGMEGEFTKTTLKDGSFKVIDNKTGLLAEEHYADGTYTKYYTNKGIVVEQKLPDGTHVVSYKHYCVDGDFTGTYSQNGCYKVVDNKTGNIVAGEFADGTEISTYATGNGIVTKTTLSDGSYKIVDYENGTLIESKSVELVAEERAAARAQFEARFNKIESFQKVDEWNGVKGSFEKVTYKDGTYEIRDSSLNTIEHSKPDGTITRYDLYGNVLHSNEDYVKGGIFDTDNCEPRTKLSSILLSMPPWSWLFD